MHLLFQEGASRLWYLGVSGMKAGLLGRVCEAAVGQQGVCVAALVGVDVVHPWGRKRRRGRTSGQQRTTLCV